MAAFGAFKSPVMSYLLPGMLLIFSATLISEVSTFQRGRVSKCVRIENDLCNSYNYTSMPNILGHEDQEEASSRLQEFTPLIENECSQRIKFFLCSLHFPLCDPKMKYPVPACRKMCEEVRMDCEPYLRAFGLDWPETILCRKLPDISDGGCLYPPQPEQRRPEPTEVVVEVEAEKKLVDPTEGTKVGRQSKPSPRVPRKNRQNRRRKDRREKVNVQEKVKPKRENFDEDSHPMDVDETPAPAVEDTSPMEEEVETAVEGEVHENIQPSPRWNPASVNQAPIYPKESDQDYFTDYDPEPSQFIPTDEKRDPPKCKNLDKFTYVQRLDKCLPICDVKIDVMFSSEDKVFAYYWMLACSLLCIISSSLTVGTFLVDSKRFRYPERPIIFLSLCYLLYSSAYLVRLGRGPEGSVSCVTKDDSDVKHVVMGDLESTGCTAVFFLLYYFGMAAAVWWVILSVTWFLAAGLTWGHEAIEAHGFYFHLVAWSLPAIQTIVVLVMGKVDGDELTGLCYVGNLDRDSLLYYVIVPLTTYLAIGALALGCGFLSLLRIRRVILRKSRGKDAGKLEKLMLKIGIFSVLYIVPTACVVAVHVYQHNNYAAWLDNAEGRPCNPPGFTRNQENLYDRNYQNAQEYPPYYERGQGYADYEYADQYLPQRPYYTQFDPPYPGYDRSQYALPDSSFTGYGQSRYPDTLLPRYPYKPGHYQPDYRYQTEDSQDTDPQATYGAGSRSIYTGRALISVPQDFSQRYPSRRYYRRKPMKPMEFNPQIAEALKGYGEKTSPREINKVQTGGSGELDCHLQESIPSFPIFAIKIFMSLLAGITSGVWVWSGKTYKSWKLFCKSSWCGKKHEHKESSGNTAHGTSSAPPSVTSHLLPKNSGRPSPDGELPADGNRNSYPIISSDRYQGYHSVRQDDDDNDVTGYMSQAEHRGNTTGLTLGDIAREYSDNLEQESRELMGHHRSRTYVVAHSMDNDVTEVRNPYHSKHQKSHSKNNKNYSKRMKNGSQRDTPSYISKSNRAIPNIYEDSPSNRMRDSRYPNHSNRELNGAHSKPFMPSYGKNSHNRVRKFSENDANKLALVSESGLSPISISTRKKAGSAHAGIVNGI